MKQLLLSSKFQIHHSHIKWTLVVLFSCLLAISSQAQVIVTGTIVDEFEEPIPGVSVLERQTTKGTVTDLDGKFSLEVAQDAILEIRFLGYKSTEINIAQDSRTNFEIQLQPDVSDLDEVIVVGFGEQTKQTLVGSVGTVRGEDLLRVGSVNTVSEALQGALPGLTAVMDNGKPGSDAAELFIRGRSSWNSDSQRPFTLVDGVERDINQIDPNEIESISVLKDASATAVYGVRGANGVILITTKRGKSGKPQFNFTSNFGIKEPTARQTNADYLTAMDMWNEAATNDRNWGQLIPQSTIGAWTENFDSRGPFNPYFPEVNWFDELLGTGYEQTYNLNARGGTEFVKYFVSLGYRNDGDIFQTVPQEQFDPAFGHERYNWRSNFDFDISPTTRLSVNFSGNYRTRTQPGYRIDGGGEDGFGQPEFFNRIFQAPVNAFPIRYPDGFYGESVSGEHNMIMSINEGGQRTYNYYQGFYDAQLNQKLDFITKGLKFTGAINYTSFSNYERQILRSGIAGSGFNLIDVIRFNREYDYSQPIENADGTVSFPLLSEIRYPDDDRQVGPISSNLPGLFAYNRRLNYRFQFDYKRKFNDHTLSGSALMWRQVDTGRGGFPAKREEWVGRANYYYKDKYLFEANATYSGSEKFAPGLRFGFFPSMAAGWVISEEPFVKALIGNWLNFLKVNYSFGIVGSDGGPRFQYAQTFDRLNNNVNFGFNNLTPFGPRYVEGTPANPNSTWETSTIHNFSFKADLLDRLNLSVELFDEAREGILMQRRTQPSFFGTADIATGNIGSTKNRGYEIEIGWNDRITQNLNYYVNFGTAYSENRTVFRDDPRLLADYLKEAGKPIGWESRLLTGGNYNSLDDIFNAPTPIHGIAQGNLVPGDLMFVDFNGDGQSDVNDQVAMKNVQYPWRTFNLNFGFTYKNLGVNALIYAVTDVGYVFPNLMYWDFNNGFINAQPNTLERWTPETASPGQTVRPAVHLANNHNTTNSNLLFVDGSYIRLKNAEVNYKLNLNYLKRVGIQNFMVYVNGNNLLTWSYLDDRIDPETRGTSTYPIVRRYNLGLRASF